MVKEIEIDIFKAPINVLTQCCNCRCVFGSGLALEIKKRFPEAYKVDLATMSGDKNKLGSLSIAKVNFNNGLNPNYIYNLYAQYDYGLNKRQVNYEAFYSCLEYIRSIINPYWTIGIPYLIASNRAGGSWNIIKSMIYDIFDHTNNKILICKLPNA